VPYKRSPLSTGPRHGHVPPPPLLFAAVICFLVPPVWSFFCAVSYCLGSSWFCCFQFLFNLPAFVSCVPCLDVARHCFTITFCCNFVSFFWGSAVGTRLERIRGSRRGAPNPQERIGGQPSFTTRAHTYMPNGFTTHTHKSRYMYARFKRSCHPFDCCVCFQSMYIHSVFKCSLCTSIILTHAHTSRIHL
jgi:hypothetical protein